MPLIAANGASLYYELTGERGAPMVLMHGSWVDHSNWNAVVPGLAEGFRVLTYDRRGHSKSQKVPAQGSFEEDADDAADLLLKLGLAPANIVGSSSGSVIALKLATRRPEIIRTLMVHDPPAFALLRGDPSMAQMMPRAEALRNIGKVLESGDMVTGARLFEDFLSGPGAWDKLPPQQKELLVTNAPTFLDETKDPLGSTVDLNLLSKFGRPTMLTTGSRSAPAFKVVVEKLAGAIPGSKVFVFDGAGHMPHISHPDRFVATIGEFAKSSE